MDNLLMQSGNGSFSFDIIKKAWSLSMNEKNIINNADVVLEVDGILYSCLDNIITTPVIFDSEDQFGEYIQMVVSARLQPLSILTETVFKVYKATCFVTASLKILNEGNSSVKLDKCMLLCCNGDYSFISVSTPADVKPQSDIRVLCETAWVLDNSVKLIGSEPYIHKSKTIGLLYNPENKLTLNCSFLTFDRADTEISYIYNNSTSRITLEAYCNFAGYSLNPGRSIDSETAYFVISEDPYISLEDWAFRSSQYYKPEFQPKPSIGWIGGWTWRDGFSQETYEELILENVKAIQEKLNGFGIKNIWASIGNLKDMLPGNWMEENLDTFPHGWKWLINKLSEFGQNLGFWIAPFWIPDKLCDLFDEHKENLLKKDGKYVYNSYKSPYGKSGTLPKEERVGFYSLDGSHPDTHKFLEKVFTYYRQLGIRYFMIDFLYAGSGSTPGHFVYDEYYDRSMVIGPEVYRAALKVIREAAGKDTYILSSTGTTFQNIGCVDAVRVGPDCGEGRPLIETMREYPATYTMHSWKLIGLVAASMAYSYFTDRKFYYNDAFNVLTIDKPIPLEEARATVSMFGLSAGPVMLGDDIATISDERLSMLKKCLPQYTCSAKPIDLFTSLSPQLPRVFNLDVDTQWDSWKVIGIINPEASSRLWEISLKDISLNSELSYDLFDFWNEMYLGEVTGSIKLEVPAHCVKVLRINSTRPYPWLISTDMHITQGGVEVDRLEWNSENLYLKGVCKRPAGEKGNLFLKLPKGFKPLVYDSLNVAKTTDKTVIALKRIDFNVETVTWRVDFELTDEAAKVDYAGLQRK